MMQKRLLGRVKAIRNVIAPSFSKGINTHYSLGVEINSVIFIYRKIAEGYSLDILNTISEMEIETDGPYTINSGYAIALCDTIISLLNYDISEATVADRSESDGPEVGDRIVPNTKNVFIIHGHDYENLFRLKDLISNRFKLNAIILSELAEGGRTIIEKFEEEGVSASYAFALMTPDDVISVGGKQERQSRPNVIFEIGWFYGRLGRNRVSILSKSGTNIHSDLSGIVRIEFSSTVDEKLGEIERELGRAGLI